MRFNVFCAIQLRVWAAAAAASSATTSENCRPCCGRGPLGSGKCCLKGVFGTLINFLLVAIVAHRMQLLIGLVGHCRDTQKVIKRDAAHNNWAQCSSDSNDKTNDTINFVFNSFKWCSAISFGSFRLNIWITIIIIIGGSGGAAVIKRGESCVIALLECTLEVATINCYNLPDRLLCSCIRYTSSFACKSLFDWHSGRYRSQLRFVDYKEK